MARNGSQELPFLALTGLVHDDRTTALLFLQDESGLLPLGALPGDRRNAVAQCLWKASAGAVMTQTARPECRLWPGDACAHRDTIPVVRQSALAMPAMDSPATKKGALSTLKGWTTDIGPLVREHSLNQCMLFFCWLHRQTLRKTTSFASTVNTPRSGPKPRIRADRHEKTRKP